MFETKYRGFTISYSPPCPEDGEWKGSWTIHGQPYLPTFGDANEAKLWIDYRKREGQWPDR